ncbi:putative 2-haloalkanoic acid dehalogenase [Ampelomyces quisqualis]|uniref:Putative 2-haloalkanoic acid dehalogenase n=1 Tax=Ampelomyces quisqualis TaxID=50730 RepID=A0A6A5QB32_AMPQU|nr:putative 2-haloalkanoic acid dehalogenase [Ampelomyces quisqualis]
MPTKNIVFDVVGTLVSFSSFYTSLSTILSPALAPHNISPQHFAYTWQTAAELEFTFLSISSQYTPYTTVLRSLFHRTLYLCGVPNPRDVVSDEQVDACVQAYSELDVRDDVNLAFDWLRNHGWRVWCFTSSSPQRVTGYFERAGIDMPVANIISCDTLGLAKPALSAYQAVWNMLPDGDEKWFAAAHMWDVSAAKKVGFRGAWCSVLEGETCEHIYGRVELDVRAEGVLDMAKKVVEKSDCSQMFVPGTSS